MTLLELEFRGDIFRVHQTSCFAKHTRPLQIVDEKSGVNCVSSVEKQFDPVLILFRYE
jgi:hypothetical protein